MSGAKAVLRARRARPRTTLSAALLPAAATCYWLAATLLPAPTTTSYSMLLWLTMLWCPLHQQQPFFASPSAVMVPIIVDYTGVEKTHSPRIATPRKYIYLI